MLACQGRSRMEMLVSGSSSLRFVVGPTDGTMQKALKLPTLLEGEALAIWLEMTEEQQRDI